VNYPQLPIVNKIRPKIGKIVASEVWNSISARDWAYEHLKRHVDTVTSVKLSNIDLQRYFPKIAKTVLVEDGFKRTMELAVDCSTVTGWTNTTLDSGQGKQGDPAIKLFTDGLSDSFFDFGRPVQFFNQEKIGFYIKAPEDAVIQVSFSADLTPAESETFIFGFPDDGVLSYKDFAVTWPFRYIRFAYVAGNVHVDDFLVFCETKKQQTTTIKKMTITWNDKGVFCDAEGGYILSPESDEHNRLSRKVRVLESINNI
jgi:hypothetical protein